jgi:type I restriction enzyme, S subunit
MDDSEIPWIGKIPKNWNIVKIKYNYDVITGKVLQLRKKNDDDILINFITSGNVFWNNVRLDNLSKMWATKEEIKKLRVEENDLLMCEGGEAGRCTILTGLKTDCIIQNHVHVIREKNFSSKKFLMYVMKFYNDIGLLPFLVEKVGINSISSSTLNNLQIPTPDTLDEQKQIVNFLDKKIKKIDDEIFKNYKLIKLLHEKRESEINYAVTRGLNDKVTMIDSEIPWIGKIPITWSIKRLKFVCKINPSKLEIQKMSDDEFVSFLPMEKVSAKGELELNEIKQKEQVYDGFTYFKNNDVIVAKITPCFENGKGALCKNLENGIGFGSTEFHVLRAIGDTEPNFIYHLTRSDLFKKIGESMMIGAAGQKRVPLKFLENFKFALPPNNEQKDIVKYIETKIKHIDLLISKIDLQIEQLQEFRKCLISLAVTGKIKVPQT